MPVDRVELPSTVQRSPKHAQEIFEATLRSAIEEYGEGERARRTAFASLKHSYEKVGDHWERKQEKGPSDEGAERRGRPTRGGVDANASKAHLLEVARRLDVPGRTRMTKDELVEAIQKANDRETRHAREAGR
ncbi:MAG: ChaB family protein [Candidatus Nanopelagicales bacterium]